MSHPFYLYPSAAYAAPQYTPHHAHQQARPGPDPFRAFEPPQPANSPATGTHIPYPSYLSTDNGLYNPSAAPFHRDLAPSLGSSQAPSSNDHFRPWPVFNSALPDGRGGPHLPAAQYQYRPLPDAIGKPGSHPKPSLAAPAGTLNSINPSLLRQPASPPIPATSIQGIPRAAPLKVTLRIPRPESVAIELPPASDAMHRRSSTVIKTEQVYQSGRPTRAAQKQAQVRIFNYNEDDPSDIDGEGEFEGDDEGIHALPSRRSEREKKAPQRYTEDDDGDFEGAQEVGSPVHPASSRSTRRRSTRIIHDPDEDEEPAPPPRIAFPTRLTRHSLQSSSAPEIGQAGPSTVPAYTNGNGSRSGRAKAAARPARSSQRSKSRHSSADGESFEPSDEDAPTIDDPESEDPINMAYEEDEDDEDDLESRSISPVPMRRQTRSQARSVPSRKSTRKSARHESDDDSPAARRRNLREKKHVNYALPPLDISAELSSNMIKDAIAGAARPNGRARGAGLAAGNRYGKGLPWSMQGRDLAQAMGDPDTSDSDDMMTPMKASAAAGPSTLASGLRASAPTDVPNFGRINPKSSTADADPLGVDMNVTFENVGGLDNHINQLKEMVALPLLYPELFQQFGITPPRGVLFHGPPGTGKTLLARALAASCSSGNTKIAFFMRKGADVLSKWVGEAERQLRMLFEEARAAQPSIIFFDEIDGLAPVRSSKQDQIHASLVSTLLALMDGMDGRGQVIVIGATNRPDAVDPALRRPGRFDREFYFPLPNQEARRKIIEINTRKWEPKLGAEMLDRLALLTKGYGGADLRALCTEAALNAIQRRYPQIYRSSDRFQLDAASIQVTAKDFMMSVKKIVPSSARSTSSSAIQLPPHLAPLLTPSLDEIKRVIERVMPRQKAPTALEEAEFEDEGDEYEKHMMLQSFDKLRTHRPRVFVGGKSGMGQNHLGPAILHHLEGYHVQNFDLGTLLGDSTSSVEAGLVQLFVEAKRHQPSIIYLPSLAIWSQTLSESARATFRALLDGVPPSDPMLVLGLAESEDVEADVWSWFADGDGRVELSPPNEDERAAFFTDFLAQSQLSPANMPGGIERKKRVFEDLPLAAPLPPRPPTEAEIAREAERDSNARNMMVISFTAFIGELLKKYRKVVAGVRDDAMELSRILEGQAAAAVPAASLITPGSLVNGDMTIDGVNMPPATTIPDINMTDRLGAPTAVSLATTLAQPLDGVITNENHISDIAASFPATSTTWQAHNVDIDTIQRKLVKHKYFTPNDFLADVALIEDNAAKLGDPDRHARVAEMAAQARLHVASFDPKWTPEFEAYSERVKARRAERAKRKAVLERVGEKEGEGAEVAVEDGGELVNGQLSGLDGLQKRGREDDETEAEGRDGKRSRPDQLAAMPTPLGALSSMPPAAMSALSSPLSSLASPLVFGHPADASTSNSVPPPRPAVASTPTFPPLVLPMQPLADLALALRMDTEGFNVDELEKLRAGLYDRLWRGRREWDRGGMLQGMLEWVGRCRDGVARKRNREGRDVE